MKIIKVKYSKLVSDNHYNNVSFGAEAEVENETPEDAMTNLAYWVNENFEKLGLTTGVIDDLSGECERLENRKNQLEINIRDAKEQFEWLKNILEKHGVEFEHLIPF